MWLAFGYHNTNSSPDSQRSVPPPFSGLYSLPQYHQQSSFLSAPCPGFPCCPSRGNQCRQQRLQCQWWDRGSQFQKERLRLLGHPLHLWLVSSWLLQLGMMLELPEMVWPKWRLQRRPQKRRSEGYGCRGQGWGLAKSPDIGHSRLSKKEKLWPRVTEISLEGKWISCRSPVCIVPMKKPTVPEATKKSQISPQCGRTALLSPIIAIPTKIRVQWNRGSLCKRVPTARKKGVWLIRT